MIILKSSKELYSHFFEDIMRCLPSRIIIMTYGAWCGINSKGDVSNNLCTTFRLLYYLNMNSENCKTTIIVGYDGIIPEVIIKTAMWFDKIEFISVNASHSKCIVTSTGILSVGSSNLNDSTWFELNLYDHVNVDTAEFLDIHESIQRYILHGERITKDYKDVDITKLISGVNK